MNTELEQAIIDRLEYREGLLFWGDKEDIPTRERGKEAGSLLGTGYKRVRVNKVDLLQHRVIFFMHYGYWPKEVDHINRVRDDNRIENLRGCESWQNKLNKKRKDSQNGGNVHYHERAGKYQVRLSLYGKMVSFGLYKDLEFAQLVASEARNKYYGEFAYDY